MLKTKNLKVSESGRSMVEMIGVLAVIMVLTMVGIYGFSKGMAKYKTDKVIDQVTTIQHNLNEFYTNQRTFKGLGESRTDLTELSTAIELGIFPEEMIQTVDGKTNVIHAWGGTVTLETVSDGGVADNAVEIVLNGLPDDAILDLSNATFNSNNVSINGY